MSQSTWTTSSGVGDSGQLATMAPHFVESFVSEGSSNVPFGVAVVRGSADTGFIVPAAVTNKADFLGVLLKSHAEANPSVEAGVVSQYHTGSIIRSGIVYVKPEQAVTPSDDVYVRFSVNTTEQLGAFRKDADSGKAFKLEGARWLTSASANEAAQLQLFDNASPNAGEKVMLSFSFQLENIADGDIITSVPLEFAGKVTNMYTVVTEPATTADKLSTLNMEINAVDVTGGTLALTSAAGGNVLTLGEVAEAAAITATDSFNEGDTLSVEASSTTAFIEGEVQLFIELEKL